ncbi:TniQ family protein [Streptomyces sp. NBC_00038]|uniref:TniQ family protein n=1 Tax=Streptomyces sp. NBC_00038 TaxID=2903615 RepID=UPI00225ACA4E|nr:TniQ family protein [Streptomyces sp. NBC_00038]MCX5559511.1 TniQ family protein [Streptomyces sp. NBC_00038]
MPPPPAPDRPTADSARTTSRRLPVVPLPQHGESLFSWIDHLATHYEVDRTQIMDRLGLKPATAHAARLARHTAELPLASAVPLHTATGVDPKQLRDMTLFGIVRTSTGRLDRHPEFRWAPEETWAFCPHCLRPPARWPLWWYQSWAVMCPKHRCYTASFCPDCGSPFSPSALRGDAPGRCPGFMPRADDPVTRPPHTKRRTKRQRCGRPLWEIDTPPATDPAAYAVFHSLLEFHDEETPSPDLQQWYDDLRTLRILLKDPHALRVQAFTSTDLALQERFTADEGPSRWGEPAPVISWRRSDSGFLFPMRRTSPNTWTGQRDPVSAAAKLTVIAAVLDSQDPAASARDVFTVRHPAGLRDFDDQLPSYMNRASPALRELLSQALDAQALARLPAP